MPSNVGSEDQSFFSSLRLGEIHSSKKVGVHFHTPATGGLSEGEGDYHAMDSARLLKMQQVHAEAIASIAAVLRDRDKEVEQSAGEGEELDQTEISTTTPGP